MKFPLRFFIGFFSIIILFSSFALPMAFAQKTTQELTQNPAEYIIPATEDNVPHNLHTLSQSLFFEAISAVICQLSGIDITSASQQCLSYNPSTDKIGYAPVTGGLVGLSTNWIAALFTPPFHTADYVKYMASNFGITKHAYAATSGFDQLAPLAKLWVGFRNIIYLLFVVIFVVIGFAIMVRAKVDPRTVMTIENQIPKIIVALLLVTFSFAIAGILIDLMWLNIYIIINVFASLDPRIPIHTMVINLHQNPFSFVNESLGNGGIMSIALRCATAIYDTLNTIVQGMINTNGLLKFIVLLLGWSNMLSPIACMLTGIKIPPDVGGTIKCINDSAVTTAAFIGGAIAFLIFLFALLAALFRLLFALLKAYVLFLIYVVMGPFFIMLGVLPGSKINFEHWLRHIVAYLAVFPMTIGILLLGQVLADAMGSSQTGFVPPLLGSDQASSSTLSALIGFAVLLLAPSALAMVEEYFAAPPFKFLPQIGQGMAAGGSIVTGGFNRAIWDPLFRERNIATGAQEGLVRGWFTGGINDSRTPGFIRNVGRWFGLRREAEGYRK